MVFAANQQSQYKLGDRDVESLDSQRCVVTWHVGIKSGAIAPMPAL
jgi:hypothetical protein